MNRNRKLLKRLLGGLFVMLLVAVIMLAWHGRLASKQKMAVELLRSKGIVVGYDFQIIGDREVPFQDTGTPRWLVDTFGIDFFSDVTSIRFRGPMEFTPELKSAISSLTGLRFVHRGTYFSDESIVCLANLPNLEFIDLRGARVTDRGILQLGSLPAANKLILTRTGVTDDGLGVTSRMPLLKSLQLDDTQVTGVGLKHVASARLRSLSLRNTPTDDRIIPVLKKFPELESIDLSRTKITDATVFALTQLPNLQEIILVHDSDVTPRHLNALMSLPQIKRLDICGCDIQIDDVLATSAKPESLEISLYVSQVDWPTRDDRRIALSRRNIRIREVPPIP